MNHLLIILTLSFTAAAIANPFDAFEGEYKVSSSPQIKSENAKECNRFDFKNINGLKVEKNTNGYQQTHVLKVITPYGWSGVPVMDFNYTNPFNSAGSYAKTTGSTSFASNEYGTWVNKTDHKETLMVSLENSASGYNFKMTEALYENSVLSAACYYQVQITKY